MPDKDEGGRMKDHSGHDRNGIAPHVGVASATTADIIVVGAGIVGAACAEALSADGLSVTVVDPRGPGTGGATAAGMGHLVVMDDSEAQFALTQYSRTLWDQFAATLPADVELERAGTLWVAADEDEMAEVHRKHAFYGRRAVATEILDPRQLAQAEPNLLPGLAGGLRVPDDGVLYPPTAARWLMERAAGRGARHVRGQAVEVTGRHVRLTDGSTLDAGRVILAAGMHSPSLLPGLDVRPRKGHLVITDRYPGFVRHQLVELGYLKSAHGSTGDSVAFNVQPRQTGQLLIGSSRQYGGDDPAVEHAILRRMVARAVEYMPRLAGLSALRTWTGFRPSTPDKLPLIGPAPHDPQLILATGHEGLGITTATGTARLVADHVAGRAPAIPLDPYLPARFARREVAHA